MMMSGFLSQVLLVAVVTAFLQPHREYSVPAAAAADSLETNSQMNVTYGYGCVGLYCLVAGDVQGNFFTTQQITALGHVSMEIMDQSRPAVPCPPGKRYSTCLPGADRSCPPNAIYLKAQNKC
ncbi:hypothetical protein RJT34_18399 [Clitoria ternatea]|uniref:Cyclotide n=1 Tax=Clitoria ternatea TaxID=43366 RepID=A0AAN9JAQ2_CLITE